MYGGMYWNSGTCCWSQLTHEPRGCPIGFFCPDIARSPEDFEQCEELLKRFDSAGLVPPWGNTGNITYVIRDEDDRSKVHAMIHQELAIETRAMIVDPEYKHSQISFTMLHRGMEMNMRTNGIQRYYFTAPESNKRAIAAWEKDGAEIIDKNVVRFMRRL